MSSKVSANELPLVCKGPDAKSVAAFPDTCMSPPGPPVGPLPLPYPSTAMAADLSQGSKTVKAGGNPIMIQGSSIAKTTGDEAATNGFGAALVTGVIQGAAFPQSFSPNVKVEGKPVVRSLDLVTHNHAGPMPGNTPPWPILGT
jgi:uncharacterized Zn-binding protein involved in type VI secretion